MVGIEIIQSVVNFWIYKVFLKGEAYSASVAACLSRPALVVISDEGITVLSGLEVADCTERT